MNPLNDGKSFDAVISALKQAGDSALAEKLMEHSAARKKGAGIDDLARIWLSGDI